MARLASNNTSLHSRGRSSQIRHGRVLFGGPGHEDRQVEQRLHDCKILAVGRLGGQYGYAEVDQGGDDRSYGLLGKAPL